VNVSTRWLGNRSWTTKLVWQIETASSDAVFFRVQFFWPDRESKHSPMKIIFRLIAFLLFLVFFGFALKNTDEVVLHLFWNAQTKSPLILLLLAFFILGAVLGVLAMTTTLMRYRREATRQKNLLAQQLKVMESAAQARLQTPFADSVIQQAGL
jgi:putative membrane protein